MSEIDPIELLVLWWRAERDWTPVEGFPVECPSTRGWRASRQYDDGNGAQDTDQRGMLIRHIGQVVAQIEQPYRTALYMVARNRASGTNVWRSPRLPEDATKRAELVAEAIDRFAAAV